MDKLLLLLDDLLHNQALIKLVLGMPRKKSLEYKKVIVRPITIKNTLMYQAEYHFEKKVTHENLDKEAFLSLFAFLMQENFKQANIFSLDADYQVLASKPENPKIIRNNPTLKMPDLAHNNKKKYIISDGIPCDFLAYLGVMNEEGFVHKKHYAKFRQINRFLEIVDDVAEHLPKDKELTIIDFGCGKAYLTFALYYYLNVKLQKNAKIIGLDLKEDVISFCNQVARDLNYSTLHFEMGDIAKYNENINADMVVTLHACDTATDYALLKANSWNASIILSVPCCQHELFDQLKNNLHQSMLKHGILKERFCGILTDTLRTLKLEEWGYEVNMIEFTSLEHTSKNIMIRAVKANKNQARIDSAKLEFMQLKEFWEVNPTIDI